MIEYLGLEGFKCFRRECLTLRALTVLTGANGVGKSSVMQALLLLRQASQAPVEEQFVKLNGRYGLQLGQVQDVIRRGSQAEEALQLRLWAKATDHAEVTWNFVTEDPEANALRFLKQPYDGAVPPLSAPAITYLSAERLGPRLSGPVNSLPLHLLHVGNQGEFTAQVQAQLERRQVPQALRHGDPDMPPLLRHQTEAWMRELMPRFQLLANLDHAKNLASVLFGQSEVESDLIKPTNTGFGISYSLPIITAALASQEGSLFLVENPEAHLHPSGQSKMGQFLGRLSAAGVQVIIETHSDHIINGIRLATVDEQHPLERGQVIIHHFHHDDAEGRRAMSIEIDRHGGLSHWPEGFFDQSEKDLRAILLARGTPAQTRARLLARQDRRSKDESQGDGT